MLSFFIQQEESFHFFARNSLLIFFSIKDSSCSNPLNFLQALSAQMLNNNCSNSVGRSCSPDESIAQM
jgi:hypothetical protein